MVVGFPEGLQILFAVQIITGFFLLGGGDSFYGGLSPQRLFLGLRNQVFSEEVLARLPDYITDLV